MARAKRHIGLIRPFLLPNPKAIAWGSISEVAEAANVSVSTVYTILAGKDNSMGWRVMTEEERTKYYQQPIETKTAPRTKHKNPKSQRGKWYITFYHNWKKGTPLPKNPQDKFSGTISEFLEMTGAARGNIHNLISLHLGEKDRPRIKSIKGWTIYKISKKTNLTPLQLARREREKRYQLESYKENG